MKPRLSQIPLQFLIALDDQKVGILLPGVCLTNIGLSILLLQCESCTLNHPMHDLKTTRSMKEKLDNSLYFLFDFMNPKFHPTPTYFHLCVTQNPPPCKNETSIQNENLSHSPSSNGTYLIQLPLHTGYLPIEVPSAHLSRA